MWTTFSPSKKEYFLDFVKSINCDGKTKSPGLRFCFKLPTAEGAIILFIEAEHQQGFPGRRGGLDQQVGLVLRDPDPADCIEPGPALPAKIPRENAVGNETGE